jgi:hypothetical protein
MAAILPAFPLPAMGLTTICILLIPMVKLINIKVTLCLYQNQVSSDQWWEEY